MKPCLVILLFCVLFPSAQADERVDRWLKQFDKNKDGTLVPDETSGLMKRFFKQNDADHNRVLDLAELQALSTRLAKRPQPQQKSPTARPRAGLKDEAVRQRVPEGVTFVPHIAYREGGASPRWRLDLFHPGTAGKDKRPAILFVHGGGWKHGDKRSGYVLQGAMDYAAKGYVTVTVNYRLTTTDPFPACVEDVKCALRWLRAHADTYQLDPERIGAYGNSAGGHLVCMLGLVGKDAGLEGDGGHLEHAGPVQAVCASAPPTDFTLQGWPNRMGQDGALLAGPAESLQQRIRQCSPVHHAGPDAPPFYLVHGTKDGTVDVEHSIRLATALEKAGTMVRFDQIEGAGHGVFTQHAKTTRPAMEAFFDRHLRAPTPREK